MWKSFNVVLCIVVTLTAHGCKLNERSGHRVAGAPTPQGAASAGERAHDRPSTPYPYAAWRIGDRSQLEHVVLWVSHILIRFHGAKNDEVSFNLASWQSVLPPPKRSRLEALAIAESVARRAEHAPASFGALAQQYSEDLPTRDHGGSLGGVTASQLTLWPQVLDALAATAPGQTSRVVETWYGFHIFYRSPTPPEDTVTGSQIVIGHNQAGWLPVVVRGELPDRSRDAALKLATEVYERAKSNPDGFEALVERYSEHRTALVQGDFGTYNTREPSWFPREVEVLSRLQVGEVAPPIDTPVGFQVLRRMPNRVRGQYAMDSLWLGFDPSAAEGHPSSRSAVLAKATALAQRIGGDPQRFAAIQKTECCTYVQQWQEGRRAPALKLMLDALAPGQVSRTPVQAEFNFVIAKRTDPVAVPEATPRFELPAPERPDVEYHLTNIQAPLAQKLMSHVAQKTIAELELSGDLAEKVQGLHELRGVDDNTELADRGAALDKLAVTARRLLGDERYAKYRAVLEREVRAYLLDPANETAVRELAEGL